MTKTAAKKTAAKKTAAAPKTKSATQKVGSLWALRVTGKESAEFLVSGPLGTRRVTTSRKEGNSLVADFVLDAPGDFSAVATVDGSDSVDGFAVSAK